MSWLSYLIWFLLPGRPSSASSIVEREKVVLLVLVHSYTQCDIYTTVCTCKTHVANKGSPASAICRELRLQVTMGRHPPSDQFPEKRLAKAIRSRPISLALVLGGKVVTSCHWGFEHTGCIQQAMWRATSGLSLDPQATSIPCITNNQVKH